MAGEGRTAPCRQHAHDDRGQVVVLVALLLPVFLALSAVVVDVGNWYVHKKHLQTLVDAGALAAAPKFVGCSYQFGDPAAANHAIRDTALEYAGDPSRDPATRNRQHQEPDDVHVLLNSTRYWEPGDPTSGLAAMALDFNWDIDADGGGGDPCSERSLDVKATDEDVPLLLGLIPLFPDVKARARIEVRQIVEQNGMLPWAVPEVEPAAVAALFVDENSGDVIASQRLDKRDDPDLPFDEWVTAGLEWNTDGTPRSELVPNASRVDLRFENTGVVILVAKVIPFPSGGTLDLTGTLPQICGQEPGVVSCYAGDGNQDGLTFIHGWSDANGTPAAPVVRDVSVLNVNCEDDSAPYFLRTGDCDLGATAVLHFEPTPGFDPRTAEVVLEAPGCGRNGCTMSFDRFGSGIGETIWTGFGARFADDFFGRSTFSISVTTEFPVGVEHQRTFTGVAHPYVAEPADLRGNQAPPGAGAGPVEYLKLSTLDPVPDANSRNTGDPPLASVIVTVGLRPPFQIQSTLEPPVVLRVASPSGSQNQAFDCDRPYNFQTEIENGCQTTYRENYGDWDDDGVMEWSDLLCDDYPNGAGLPPDTFTPAPPPDCVRVETGDKVGQFRHGIDLRLRTPSCAPNNWPQNAADIPGFFTDHDFATDPRYVTLIVTDYGTFQGSGSSSAVPVKYFAGFYITGWDKTSNNLPCADNEPHPWYSPGYRRSLDNGDVWGHFINVVAFSASGAGSDDLCNFDEVGTCIVGLVE